MKWVCEKNDCFVFLQGFMDICICKIKGCFVLQTFNL
jgi:hypothetical protein